MLAMQAIFILPVTPFKMYLSSQIPPQCLYSHIFSTWTPKHVLFPNVLISLSETTLLRLPISLATYKRVFLFQSKSPYFPENFLYFFFSVFIRDFQIRRFAYSQKGSPYFLFSKVHTLICSGAPWVREFGYRCIHEILVLRKSSVRVRTYVHPLM